MVYRQLKKKVKTSSSEKRRFLHRIKKYIKQIQNFLPPAFFICEENWRLKNQLFEVLVTDGHK